MSSSSQRKRVSTGSPAGSSPGTKTSRAANARTSRAANARTSRAANARTSRAAYVRTTVANARTTAASRRARSAGDPAPPTETIDVMDNADDGVEEVVDLTREGTEAAVVDLTTINDSVLLLDGGSTGSPGSGLPPETYVVSEDEDAPPTVLDPPTPRNPDVVICPICLDLRSEILSSGRLVISTKCGHVFCSRCLRKALRISHTCPTCRQRVTKRQYHPIYI
ncbi:RING finger protein 4 [Cololabis saira]|uniref:RING finger protein 4 n=1 Tax=Cololabis saira TaxID=129043 RepID=UPI002AD235AF|nr:RING finger protein 4 [Cololabis saira]XP_061582083.1 RING finger protein 4 [Cololabis saira]